MEGRGGRKRKPEDHSNILKEKVKPTKSNRRKNKRSSKEDAKKVGLSGEQETIDVDNMGVETSDDQPKEIVQCEEGEEMERHHQNGKDVLEK